MKLSHIKTKIRAGWTLMQDEAVGTFFLAKNYTEKRHEKPWDAVEHIPQEFGRRLMKDAGMKPVKI